MTFDELLKLVRAILPNAYFNEEEDGQLMICTGLKENPEGAQADLLEMSEDTH